MSAFMVDRFHIDQLVDVARFGPKGARDWYPFSWCHEGQRHELTDGLSETGRMLWGENLASVHYRYPDTEDGGELPGPIDLTADEVSHYLYQAPPRGRQMTAVEGLKAIRCFTYQACEQPGWRTSEAYEFCRALTDCLVACLPGYEAAPWEQHRERQTA